jgi:hypothetical protein
MKRPPTWTTGERVSLGAMRLYTTRNVAASNEDRVNIAPASPVGGQRADFTLSQQLRAVIRPNSRAFLLAIFAML